MSRTFKFQKPLGAAAKFSRNTLPMRVPESTSPANATNDAEAWQDELDQGRDR